MATAPASRLTAQADPARARAAQVSPSAPRGVVAPRRGPRSLRRCQALCHPGRRSPRAHPLRIVWSKSPSACSCTEADPSLTRCPSGPGRAAGTARPAPLPVDAAGSSSPAPTPGSKRSGRPRSGGPPLNTARGSGPGGTDGPSTRPAPGSRRRDEPLPKEPSRPRERTTTATCLGS